MSEFDAWSRGSGGGEFWGGFGPPSAPPSAPSGGMPGGAGTAGAMRQQLATLQGGGGGGNPYGGGFGGGRGIFPGGPTTPQNTPGLGAPGAPNNFSGAGSGAGGWPYNLPGWGRTAVAPQQGPMRPDMIPQPTIGRGG